MQRSDVVVQDIITSDFQWVSRESDVLVQASSPQDGVFLVLNELQLRYDPVPTGHSTADADLILITVSAKILRHTSLATLDAAAQR